jgi:hypothetical protein
MVDSEPSVRAAARIVVPGVARPRGQWWCHWQARTTGFAGGAQARSGAARRVVRAGGNSESPIPGLVALPHRGDGTVRPAGLALPPGPMPRWAGGRPLKRWRYVGIFGPEVMLCAGVVSIAGVRQRFWAVWDRGAGDLRERTRLGGGGVRLPWGRVLVDDGVDRVDLELAGAGDPVEVVSPHGEGYVWTRKLPVRARGTACGVPVDARGLIDETAGYHARRTAWLWSAGVGTGVDGAAVAWNLVDGIHDAPGASERTVWEDGAAREVDAVAFAADLGAVGDLRFTPEARRARRERLVVLESDYEQPFGTFAGALPGGIALAEGFGVMERHAARW